MWPFRRKKAPPPPGPRLVQLYKKLVHDQDVGKFFYSDLDDCRLALFQTTAMDIENGPGALFAAIKVEQHIPVTMRQGDYGGLVTLTMDSDPNLFIYMARHENKKQEKILDITHALRNQYGLHFCQHVTLLAPQIEDYRRQQLEQVADITQLASHHEIVQYHDFLKRFSQVKDHLCGTTGSFAHLEKFKHPVLTHRGYNCA